MDVTNWKVSLTFSSPVDNLEIWVGLNSECSGNVCTFENQGYNGQQLAGTEVKVDFQMSFSSQAPDLIAMTVNDIDVCTGGGNPSTSTSGPTTTTEAPTPGPTTITEAPTPGSTTTTTSGPPTTIGGSTTTTLSPGSCVNDKYGFADALDKSLLFYEAQRSGSLPSDMRITWRKDSALDDKGENDEDLTGGYYDGNQLCDDFDAFSIDS